jgi:D-3-phosphoglycerate dehydrogenase
MKVLLADALPAATMTALEGLGVSAEVRPELGPTDLPGAISGAHVLVVRSTKVSADTFEAADALQLVIRAGAGTNTIDCDAAAGRAIHVANCPGKNAVAVAELTFGLVLSLDRRIPDNVASLRDGRWEKGTYGKGRGLLGATFGIAGMGRIGQEVASRAKAFGMNVLAYDPFLSSAQAAELGVALVTTIAELCAGSDVISVHVPKTDDTTHLFDAAAFAAMKPGTLFVHVARGGVVDDAAMADAVSRGHIRAAADVFETEPKGSSADYDGLFREVDGFYGTHHIGASTAQAQEAIGDEVVRIISTWLATGEVLNCVNRSSPKTVSGQLLLRHHDEVGVLAAVLGAIRAADISVKEMKNAIFDGTGSAVATISLDRAPSDDVLRAVRSASPHVLGVEWVSL